MPDKIIRILDFDGSVTSQRRLLSEYDPKIVDLKSSGPLARFWANKKVLSDLEKAIPPSEDSITFLGSGDFHHISSILISRYRDPFSVISFDFHPDWDTVAPVLTCGSWVSSVLKKRDISKLILVSIASGDISSFWMITGDLASLKDDRLEIYPYIHTRSSVLFRNVPDNISIIKKRSLFSTEVRWNELYDKDIFEFFSHIIKRLPTENVYVSIDKDCLKREYAVTNWEEGRLTLDELLEMLKLIKDNRRIVGVDITGDYSDIKVNGILKNIISYIDHPRRPTGKAVGKDAGAKINEDTNLKILELLNS